MRIIVILDSKYTLTERRVYTFADMLGKAGGFMGAILSISRVFAYLFTSKFYSMTLLTYFYKVDEYANDDFKPTEEENLNNPRSEIYRDEAGISEEEEAKARSFQGYLRNTSLNSYTNDEIIEKVKKKTF
mmetsp:Transcript_3389/g.2839  ORF Transcript_3389/g.2839 Transcript_3389/m.2839 type:complete len:130 (+) Transcript_3389:909-1298(+)